MIRNIFSEKVLSFSKDINNFTEEELINLARQGNDNAFESLIDKYEDYIYKMAFICTKNEHDALDIFQDTVLKAYISISKLKNPNFFKTWITKILINNVHTSKRYSNRVKDTDLDDYVGDISYSNIEKNLDLYKAIDSLDDKYRTPIILQYFYNLTTLEISEVLDCNENTVKTCIRRAKKKMYDMLKEEI